MWIVSQRRFTRNWLEHSDCVFLVDDVNRNVSPMSTVIMDKYDVACSDYSDMTIFHLFQCSIPQYSSAAQNKDK